VTPGDAVESHRSDFYMFSCRVFPHWCRLVVADAASDPHTPSESERGAINRMEEAVATIVKSIVLGTFLALAPAGFAHAACGVGTTIWGENAGTGGKILAFTTNIWTFKVISTTSEISGCTEKDNIFKKASNAEIRYFASQNLDHLVADMARGHGEHLGVMAHLIQLRQGDHAEFRALAQDNFESLFPHDHVTADEMLSTLRRLMSENDALSDYVQS
jgi:hypothetical protein